MRQAETVVFPTQFEQTIDPVMRSPARAKGLKANGGVIVGAEFVYMHIRP